MRRIKPAAAESYEKKRKPALEPNENTQRMTDFLSAAFGGTVPVPIQSCDETEAEIPHNEAVSFCSDKRAAAGSCKAEALSPAWTPGNYASAELAPPKGRS